MENKKTVLIAGAGIGGLATALRLVKQGYTVEIIEKNKTAGGRLNQIKKDGFTFDTGPSFFSMSYEFEEFARDCGIELPFDYVELDPLYTVHIKGNPKTFFINKDLKKFSEQFAEYEPNMEEKMRKYLSKAGALFDDTVDLVIKNNFDTKINYLLTLARVNPVHIPVLLRSFWQQVNRYFDSKEARQIISLVAFFLGRTPFDTSSIYTLLSHTEFQHDGYYNVKGGMYKIVEGFVSELEKAGAKIHYNVEVTGYKANGNRLESLIDQTGKHWKADVILVNADAAVFRNKILKRKDFSDERMDKKNWTMGYLTIYLGIDTKLPNVHHHNYFLGSNYEEYATRVMREPGLLEKPYYYVNVLSKHNPECAPAGSESLFIVCPVPNLLHKPDWSDKDKIIDSIIEDFSERVGVDIMPHIVTRMSYSPKEWESFANLWRGSGLGLAHDIKQIGAFRPANFDEDFKNLFYVGASTHPGAGLPMAIISSKLAFERIQKLG
ncbi:MAG: phytoene desaturase [Bacteroidales bacterium]|nr:phytoene desaturase [Bacteroidales bacterium]